jgi:CBS domain containing-hemolysin-like protein
MESVLPVVLVLLLSAFFSGSEIAFISASKIEVELKRKTGGRRGRILSSFFDQPDRFIGIMLVGNNISLVILAILMNRILDPILIPLIANSALLIFTNTIITTLIVLIFGEFLPKTIFGIFSNKLLYFFTYPLNFFRWFLAIPSGIMIKSSNLFLKYVLKVPDTEELRVFTRMDLEDFVDVRAKVSEDAMETDMFKNALHLQNVKVRECMIPRTEIVHIDINAEISEAIELFKKSNLSRIIVTHNEIDEVEGYVHHLQFLTPPKAIKEILYSLPFVPEAMNVQVLLIRFMREGVNIACVVDEFGGVSGIITLEDILEEIFGEIEDEHDDEGHVELKLNDNEYLFSGRIEIDYINEKYEEINIPEGEYTTLSGYLVLTTETIPEEGAEIELNGYRYVIVQVSDKKIETVRVIHSGLDA